MPNSLIKKNFEEHKKLQKIVLDKFEKKIFKITDQIIKSLLNKKKILWCGNGGSATDSMHLSAEMVGRFNFNRKPFNSISLASDIANMTCISNDFSFENIFDRQIDAIGSKGDILISLSTSGNSLNIKNAIKMAKKKNIITISLLGKSGGKCRGLSNIEIIVPSKSTARIQEMHMLMGHTICEIVENKIGKKSK